MAQAAAQQEWAIKTITKIMTKKCASWRKHKSYDEDVISAMEEFLAHLTPKQENDNDDESA